ncbi:MULTISPECIES: oligosaccharide flippase family protein [Methanosarcina]|uniref:Polysaccharide biosynthesis protein n=2 Tax=Methanosarcina barkeri TaxID=2208 RepID=A0A0E3QTC4_METBA|nr:MULTISPECIES: polysaccharide biosynthesis C-terminal domain-containing protein [Methanosarcina]AKB53768.1 polysaccharide biosynthesis protein [Methanosarcina barkeri MS]AKJ38900.1 polysaccharide biosynthesis protein [Methanosarcina barkeri CM1]
MVKNYSLAKDGISVFGTQMLTLIISFVSGVLLARWLGPAGRGAFTALLVYPAILISLLSLGMRQATVYYLGKQKYSESDIVGVTLLLLISSSIIGVLTSVAIISYTKNPDYNLMLILLASLTIPADLTINYFTGILIGKQQINKFNKVMYLVPIINFVLITFLVFFIKLDILGAVLATLIAKIVLAIYALLSINSEYSLKICWKSEIITKMVSIGFIYAFSLFILNLNYRVDIIILERLSNVTEIGQYTIGVGFAELLWQLPTAFGLVIFAYSANSKNSNKFSQDIAKMVRIIFPVVLIGSVFLYFASGYIIPFLYGEEYIPSIRMLKILLPGIVMMSFFKIINMDLAGRGKPDITIKLFLPAVLINIVLNIILIPDFGGCGAAFASTISYTLASVSILYYYMKITQLSLSDIFICKKSDINFILGLIHVSPIKR